MGLSRLKVSSSSLASMVPELYELVTVAHLYGVVSLTCRGLCFLASMVAHLCGIVSLVGMVAKVYGAQALSSSS